MTWLFKIVIRIFGSLVKLSRSAVDYCLQVVFRKEVEELAAQEASIINSPFKHIEETIDVAKQLGDEPHVIVDIGGGHGDVADRFARAFPKDDVIVFEPQEACRADLEKLVNRMSNVTWRKKGLGTEPGTLTLHLNQNEGSSSLLESHEQHHQDLVGTIGEEEIEISTLDAELDERPIRIMKLDVQGYELAAMKGGSSALSRTSFVLLEVSNHGLYKNAPKYYEVDEFMRNNGFELQNLFPSFLSDQRIMEWDALYRRS